VARSEGMARAYSSQHRDTSNGTKLIRATCSEMPIIFDPAEQADAGDMKRAMGQPVIGTVSGAVTIICVVSTRHELVCSPRRRDRSVLRSNSSVKGYISAVSGVWSRRDPAMSVASWVLASSLRRTMPQLDKSSTPAPRQPRSAPRSQHASPGGLVNWWWPALRPSRVRDGSGRRLAVAARVNCRGKPMCWGAITGSASGGLTMAPMNRPG